MTDLSPYASELRRAMHTLAEDERVVFLGQAVRVAGTAMRTTLEDIDPERLIELPVEEDLQLGMSVGMAIAGMVPVSVFPRWNFVVLAANQLVNHLDKLGEMIQSIPPKVIIRTSIGSVNPLDPGPQHQGDLTEGFRLLCPHIEFVRLDSADVVVPAYERALRREDGVSTVLVEWGDKYAA